MTSLSNKSPSTYDATHQDDSEDAEESILSAIGFLFEGSETTTLKRFQWKRPSFGRPHDEDSMTTTTTIHVSIHLVDDEPGAVQSGHFLWPAAPALCDFLIAEQQSPPHPQEIPSEHRQPIHPKEEEYKLEGGFFRDPDSSSSCYGPQNVLELGAGCALSSWFALQLYHTTLQCLVVTDHDPSVLRRAKDNYETTLEDLYERAAAESSSPSVVQEEVDPFPRHLASIPVRFETLSWGQSEEVTTRLLQTIPCFKSSLTSTTYENENSTTTPTPASSSEPVSYFDLVLGSDLMDCIEVIEPLLTTASCLMQPPPLWAPLLLSQPHSSGKCHPPQNNNSRFLLSQSFPYDCEMEQEIETVATKLGFQRIIHDTAITTTSTTATTLGHFNKSTNNNIHNNTVTSGGVGQRFIRIQEFRCMGV
jgi:hypothetical protein